MRHFDQHGLHMSHANEMEEDLRQILDPGPKGKLPTRPHEAAKSTPIPKRPLPPWLENGIRILAALLALFLLVLLAGNVRSL